ncbi:MAG: hypothetical protein ACJAXY_001737 [Nonlabens sp.]|jgi:hypothetical protein
MIPNGSIYRQSLGTLTGSGTIQPFPSLKFVLTNEQGLNKGVFKFGEEFYFKYKFDFQ